MFDIVKRLFNKEGQLVDLYVDMMTEKNRLSQLALEIGFNKIADTVSKCPIDVYSSDEDRGLTEYALNVRPNPNEYATDFWKQVVLQMCSDSNGCLVVQMKDNSIYHADSFTESNSVLKEKTYSNVTIRSGNDVLTLDRIFTKDDAIHFKYKNDRLLQYLDKVNEENAIAWGVMLNGLKSKAGKYKLKVPANAKLMDSETGKAITANVYSEEIKKQLSSADITVILAANGIDIENIENKSSLSASDLKALKDEVFTNVAIALGIPKTVFYGEVTEKSDANNEFITYALDPVFEELNDGMNACYISKEAWLKGDRILFDTSSIKHIDVIESAGNLDKLYSNGWSHNDILKLLKKPPVQEEWADARRFTKNYAENIDSTKGGDG